MTFIYNNALFCIQVLFSAIMIAFSITMLYIGKDASVYLPVLTSIIGFWLPSPIQNTKQAANQPATLPEIVVESQPRDIPQRNHPIPILTPINSPPDSNPV